MAFFIKNCKFIDIYGFFALNNSINQPTNIYYGIDNTIYPYSLIGIANCVNISMEIIIIKKNAYGGQFFLIKYKVFSLISGRDNISYDINNQYITN